MNKRAHIAKLLLASLLISLLVSCGSEGTSSETTNSTDFPDTTEAALPEYDLSGYDYDGREYNLLNVEDIYHMHSQLDRETTTGDTFDDAMYERCRTLEDVLDIKFIETLDIYTEVTSKTRNMLNAGDDTYDAMYVTYTSDRTLGGEGLLLNLMEVDGLQFDKPWWNTNINEQSTINGVLYGAVGEAHLMQLDSVWCLYYNESMGEKLGLDTPYQTIREGKWTLEVFNEYLVDAANLNGDDSFAWKDGGKSTYGLSANLNGALYMMFAANEQIYGIVDGKLSITAGSERYYDVAELIGSMMNDDGRVYRMTSGSGDDEPDSYVHMFEIERALFCATELSKTNRMRDKEYAFGIIPYPKFDEAQETYISRNGMAMKFAIPTTAKDVEFSAIVGDALNYYSYKMVKDVFREITLEQKNLRNDDSIEMLNILFDSIQPNLVYNFGLTTSGGNLQNALRDDVFDNRGGSQASLLASLRTAVETDIAKLYE